MAKPLFPHVTWILSYGTGISMLFLQDEEVCILAIVYECLYTSVQTALSFTITYGDIYTPFLYIV